MDQASKARTAEEIVTDNVPASSPRQHKQSRSRSEDQLDNSTWENTVLKYHLIQTKTAGEVKHFEQLQTDRQ